MSETRPSGVRLADLAGRIARDVAGSEPASVTEIPKGVMTHKYLVNVADASKLLVRIYPSDRSHVVDYEPDLLRRLAGLGLPVPEVLADSRSADASEHSYLVYRWIEGTTLSETRGLDKRGHQEICETLVESLLVMAGAGVQGYGDLVDDAKATHESWAEFVRISFDEGLKAASDHGLFDDGTTSRLRRIHERLDEFLEPTDSELVWGDISPDHIVLDDTGRLVGLLDFEGTLAAGRLSTLGYCHAVFDREPFFEGLSRAWPQHLDLDDWRRIHFSSALRVMRIAKFAAQPLPTGAKRSPLADRFPGLSTALSKLQM